MFNSLGVKVRFDLPQLNACFIKVLGVIASPQDAEDAADADS